MAYKKDQGRMARMAAFWSLAILIFYGCTSLRTEMGAQWGSLAEPIGGIVVPIIGIDLSPAFLISALVLFASLFLLYRWQNSPKTADLLIDTEAEMRKVTWPTIEETINGSIVVVVCVLFLMAYLAGADWLLGKWAKMLFITGFGA